MTCSNSTNYCNQIDSSTNQGKTTDVPYDSWIAALVKVHSETKKNFLIIR